MRAWVYILYFEERDKYYVGSTTDIGRRLKQHSSGHTPSTKRLGKSFRLVFKQRVQSVKIARSTERKIKSWKRRDYIERIVDEQKIRFLDNDN